MGTFPNDREIKLRISGEDCACRLSDVKKALEDVPGVISATADKDSAVFIVRTSAGGDAAALITAVHSAGFHAETV